MVSTPGAAMVERGVFGGGVGVGVDRDGASLSTLVTVMVTVATLLVSPPGSVTV